MDQRNMPTDFYDSSEFYWDQIHPDDLQQLREAVPDRCYWCRGIYRHHPMCDRLQIEWSSEMPFGKHRGRKVVDLPTDYLTWLAKNCQLPGDIKHEVERIRPDLGMYLLD